MRIAVDLMGSDRSPDALYRGVALAVDRLGGSVSIEVLATSDFSLPSHSQISLHPCSSWIGMDEPPLTAIRQKREASLIQGFSLLKEGKVDAFVSAGNTGAMVAEATVHMPKLGGMERPALLALVPTKKDPMVVIDVGGNIAVKASHLVQFASMGVAFHQCIIEKESTRVGLLNIGVESVKGTETLRETYQLLQENTPPSWNFLGNVEGRKAFEGEVDVLVTDGFAGNIFLKTAEGLSLILLEQLISDLNAQNIAVPDTAWEPLRKQYDYREYPGAVLCGINGIAIKCHGNVTPFALSQAIIQAHSLVKNEFLKKVES